MKILVNNIVRSKSGLSQWKNTNDVLNWFKNLENKSELTFIQFDVDSFYPSITLPLLKKAINFAKKYLNISAEDIEIIIEAKKSMLFLNGTPWAKKSGGSFDVTMGAYDGAETCELVGLYILSELNKLKDLEVGLYRDDGMAVTRLSPRQTEQLKKKICEVFRKQKLSISIEANKNEIDFLDVTLNLRENTFKPFRKPNDTPCYINTKSNHPPNILKNIPDAVNKRLSEISSSKAIFDDAAPPYQDALKQSGFNHTLEYNPNASSNTKSRNRSRKILWFNPPFASNVSTNIGRIFLKIVDKVFHENHPLQKIFNRNCVKVSYRCTPNLSSIISSHNSKVISKEQGPKLDVKGCNCTTKANCPLQGKCLTENVVYQATVNQTQDKIVNTYVGLTSTSFKERWRNHKTSFNLENYSKATTLSLHIWKLKNAQKNYTISWKILSKARPYSPVSGICPLRIREKYFILFKPHLATLNTRTELTSACRHKTAHLLENT